MKCCKSCLEPIRNDDVICNRCLSPNGPSVEEARLEYLDAKLNRSPDAAELKEILDDLIRTEETITRAEIFADQPPRHCEEDKS